jgi:hypothetical protein
MAPRSSGRWAPARRATGAALAAAATLLGPATAPTGSAAQWTVQPRLDQRLFYDTNPGFTTDDESPSFGSNTNAHLILGARNQTTDLTLATRLEFLRFFQESDLDTDNQYVNLRGAHRGERLELNLNSRFIRDVARDDLIDATGDRDLNNERQQTFAFEPSVTYLVTPTQKLILSAGYTRRTYPQTSGASGDGLIVGTTSPVENDLSQENSADLQNYSLYSASLAWIQAINPRLSAGLVPNFTYVDQARQNLAVGSLQGLVEYQLTPRFSFDVRAGPSIIRNELRVQEVDQETEVFNIGGVLVTGTETTFSKGSDTDIELGYVIDGGFTWQLTPRAEAALRYTHAVEPSGSEGAVTRDQLLVQLSHEITRTVRLFGEGSFQMQEQVSSSGSGSNDRTSVRIEPGIEWNVYEDVALSLRYRLRYLEFSDTDDSILSNAVILNVGLRLPELRTSW